jgi:hypothetical protein
MTKFYCCEDFLDMKYCDPQESCIDNWKFCPFCGSKIR